MDIKSNKIKIITKRKHQYYNETLINYFKIIIRLKQTHYNLITIFLYHILSSFQKIFFGVILFITVFLTLNFIFFGFSLFF